MQLLTVAILSLLVVDARAATPTCTEWPSPLPHGMLGNEAIQIPAAAAGDTITVPCGNDYYQGSVNLACVLSPHYELPGTESCALSDKGDECVLVKQSASPFIWSLVQVLTALQELNSGAIPECVVGSLNDAGVAELSAELCDPVEGLMSGGEAGVDGVGILALMRTIVVAFPSCNDGTDGCECAEWTKDTTAADTFFHSLQGTLGRSIMDLAGLWAAAAAAAADSSGTPEICDPDSTACSDAEKEWHSAIASLNEALLTPGFEHYGYAYDYADDGYGTSSSDPEQVDQNYSGGNYRLTGNSGSKLRGRLEKMVTGSDGKPVWTAVCFNDLDQDGAAEACNSIESGSTIVKTYTAAYNSGAWVCQHGQVAILCAPAPPAKTCRNSTVCPSTAQTNALVYEDPDHTCEVNGDDAQCTDEECCIDPSNASFAVAFHTRVQTTHDFETTPIALEVPAAFKHALTVGPFREGTEPTIQYVAADINENTADKTNKAVSTLTVTSAAFRADAGNCTNTFCGYHEIARAIHGPKINGGSWTMDCARFNAIQNTGGDEAASTEIGTFDLFGSKSVSHLFKECEFGTPQAIEDLDVSNVEVFGNVFAAAYNFNGDLESWDVGSATNTQDMFYYADAFDGSVGGWDVRNVKQFSSMFYDACAFTGRENSEGKTIQDWNVGSGVAFRSMFSRFDCIAKTAADGIQYNLSSWHTSLSATANIEYIFNGYTSNSTLKKDTCWYPGDTVCEAGSTCTPNFTKCENYQTPTGDRRKRRNDPDADAVVLFDIFVKPPGVGNAPIMIPGTMAQFNRNDHCSRHAGGTRHSFCTGANASFYFDTAESQCNGDRCDATDCCKGGTTSGSRITIEKSVNAAAANADVDVVFVVNNAPAGFANDAALAGNAITLHDTQSAATATGTIKNVKNIVPHDSAIKKTRREDGGQAFKVTATAAFTTQIETQFNKERTVVMIGPKQEAKTKTPKSTPKPKKSTTSSTPVAVAVIVVAVAAAVAVAVGSVLLRAQNQKKNTDGYTVMNPVYTQSATTRFL